MNPIQVHLHEPRFRQSGIWHAIAGLMALLVLTTAAAMGRPLLIDVSPQTTWLMVAPQVESGETARSIIFARQMGSQSWQKLYQIAAPVTALTHQDGEGAILLDNGQWMFIYQGGRSIGSSVPGKSRLIQIAGNKQHLFGLAWVDGGLSAMHAATQPAATTSAASSQPTTTTAPASQRLVLARYSEGAWTGVAQINDISSNAVVALGGANGKVVIAYQAANHKLIVANWTATHGLKFMPPIHTTFEIAALKVLYSNDAPIIWAAPETGAGVIYHWKNGWSAPLALSVKADLSKPAPRDISADDRHIQFVYAREDALHSQNYELSGTPMGPAEQLLSQENQTETASRWVSLAVTALLVLVLLSAFRRQEAIAQTMQRRAELNIAPMGRRLTAGLIDLTPYIVAAFIASPRAGQNTTFSQAVNNPAVRDPIVIGLIIYLAHTFICELLFSRSIGKFLTGLKVTDLQGQKATALAIIIRNLFRIIDLIVLFLPIVISPLRQRIGDLAGGTLVVIARPLAPQESEKTGSGHEAR